MSSRILRNALRICFLGLAVAGLPSLAQDYPEKPVRLIVPFSAGGSSDVLARMMAKHLGERLGQAVVVDNRPGAGGVIAAEAASRAPADGYTLLFGTVGTHGSAPAVVKTIRYDAVNGFAPVSLLHRLPLVLIANKEIPAATLQELLGFARANPGKLTFASAGVGSISHLSTELLKVKAGVDMTHVPYKGGGSAMPDLLAGRVGFMLETVPNAISAVRSGMARALAITGTQRSVLLKEVPTFDEAGLPGFDADSWTALLAPAKTPDAIVQRLNREVARMGKDPQYQEQLRQVGTEAVATTPDALKQQIRGEIAKWKEVAVRNNVMVD